MAFAPDTWSYADLVAEHHPLSSTKMAHLLALLRTGMIKIPLGAFSGRTTRSARGLYGKEAGRRGEEAHAAAGEKRAEEQEEGGETRRRSATFAE